MTEKTAGRSAAQMDLFDLPGLSHYRAAWRDATVANLGVRREAKRLLFHELAVAAAEGIPIEQALGMVAQTWGERQRELRKKKRFGADIRNTLAPNLTVVLGVVVSTWLLFLLVIMAPAMSNPERVARLMALRLEGRVRRGIPLSEAMEKSKRDYSKVEIALVRSAENAGRLPEGLRCLADYQVTSRRRMTSNGFVGYPIVLFAICTSLVLFIQGRIFPKYHDIFNQMGVDIPAPGLLFVWTADPASTRALLALAQFAIFFLLVRFLHNGNGMSRVLMLPFVLGVVFLVLAILVLPVALYFANLVGPPVPSWVGFFLDNPEFITFLSAFVITLLFIPFWLTLLERLILRIEKAWNSVIGSIPFLRTTEKSEREARWLAALSLQLEAGVTEAEALRNAGQIGGHRFLAASDRAAKLVEQGHSISDAVARSGILSRPLAARTAFALRGPNLSRRLGDVAEDQAMFATERSAQMSRIAETFGVLAIGLAVLLVVLAIYLPLFSIPLLALADNQ